MIAGKKCCKPSIRAEREPREKTEERLGQLAKPVFEIFEEGGESEKLEQHYGEPADAGPC